MDIANMSEFEFPNPVSYTIHYVCGTGSLAWHGELTVKAKSIREAMDNADKELKNCCIQGNITCIEQED